MKGIRCWRHQVSSAPAYCPVSAIRRPSSNTTYQALHLRDNLVQLPLGLLVLLDGLLQVSLTPILRPARPALTPCFRSHSSRSCSTRVTCLSKCSALTSTCRSLPSDGCLSMGLRALLGRLAQVLLRLVQLFLEQLHFTREVLPRRAVRVALVRGRLEISDFALGLVELLLGERELVLQRAELLVTLEQGLVELRGAGDRSTTGGCGGVV